MLTPAAPRFATPRSGLPTTGGRVARLAAATGKEFLPWQRQASDLVNEHSGGIRVHPICAVSTQRQAGKSSWVWYEALDRCLFGPPHQRVYLMAQTGSAARDKFTDLTHELLGGGSPLAGRLKARFTNGSERLIFPNGSQIRPMPVQEDSLHGLYADCLVIDECWNHTWERGQALLQAAAPTMSTRPGAQIIMLSTMGTAESTWWHGYSDRGRAGEIPYLEWSLGDGIDPADTDAVASAHPAVGYTITKQFLADQWKLMQDSPTEYQRAFCNRRSQVQERAIAAATWNAAATTDLLPSGRPCLGVDVAMDRSETAIVACLDGVLETIEVRTGTDWAADRVLELVDRWKPVAVAIDSIGPSGVLRDQLTRRGLDPYQVTAASYATACQALVDGLENGTVKHRRHPSMDTAVDSAAKRALGDGWAWSRRRATASIAALVAGTLASWADTHRPAPAVKPQAMAG